MPAPPPRRHRDLPGLPRAPRAPRPPGLKANAAAHEKYERRLARYEARQAEYLRIAALYDERSAYAFVPNHKGVKKNGAIEYIGPGRRGSVNCPNSSKVAGSNAPTLNCGDTCNCNRSVTIPAEVAATERQRNIFGTRRWRADYNRRVFVEGGFGSLKKRYSRGTIKTRGPKAVTMISLLIFGVALRMLRTYLVRGGNKNWIKAFRSYKLRRDITWTECGPLDTGSTNPDRDDGS